MTHPIAPILKDAIIAALVRRMGGKVTIHAHDLAMNEPADLRVEWFMPDKTYIVTAGPEIVDETVTVVEPLALEQRP